MVSLGAGTGSGLADWKTGWRLAGQRLVNWQAGLRLGDSGAGSISADSGAGKSAGRQTGG